MQTRFLRAYLIIEILDEFSARAENWSAAEYYSCTYRAVVLHYSTTSTAVRGTGTYLCTSTYDCHTDCIHVLNLNLVSAAVRGHVRPRGGSNPPQPLCSIVGR